MSTGSTRRMRYILAGVAMLGVCGVGLGSLASSALLTDQKSTTTATISAGTVTLGLGGSASTGGLAVTNMVPGDTQYTKLTVTNSGSAAARVASTATWSAATAVTNDLQLSMVTVADANAACDSTVDFNAPLNSATTTKSVSNVALTSNVGTITTSAAHGLAVGQPVTISGLTAGAALDGSFLVASVPTTTTFTVAKTNANITSAAATGTVTIPTVSTAGTSMTLYGDSTTGQQTGDRAFAATSSEYYCLKLNLPLASVGGTGADLTLTFYAEQSKNN